MLTLWELNHKMWMIKNFHGNKNFLKTQNAKTFSPAYENVEWYDNTGSVN